MKETFIDGDKTILKTDYYLYLLKLETNWKELKKWLESDLSNLSNNSLILMGIQLMQENTLNVMQELEKQNENSN